MKNTFITIEKEKEKKYEAIGDRLRRARQTLHKTQEDVAQSIGINLVTLNRFENKMKPPGIHPTNLFSEKYGIDPYWLWIGEGSSGKSIPMLSLQNISKDEVISRASSIIVKDIFRIYELPNPEKEKRIIGKPTSRCLPFSSPWAEEITHCICYSRSDMEPMIKKYSIICVNSKDRVPEDGKLFLVWHKGLGAIVRRLGINNSIFACYTEYPMTEPIILSSQSKNILGRVTLHLTVD
jgi:transcriptional regulator with XRE-family HTH domain